MIEAKIALGAPAAAIHPGFKVVPVGLRRRDQFRNRRYIDDLLKGKTMRNIAAVAVALAMGLATVSAEAMPFASAPAAGDSLISKAAYGCGPGMTRGPYGHCRPRFTCPPGWHPGPHGWHCFRNHW